MKDKVVIDGGERDVATLTEAEISRAVYAIEEHGTDEVCELADELYGDPRDGGEYVRHYFAAHEARYGAPFAF